MTATLRPRFERFELRTTHVTGARDFYENVFGAAFFSPEVYASALSERALALGAKPHWVGHIGVEDPVGLGQRIVERGGQQLGPTFRDGAGAPYLILRDPFGAMLALGARRDEPAQSGSSFHLLHTTDHEPALAFYVELFGWHPRGESEVSGSSGARQRTFAWDAAGETVGAVTNAAQSAAVHRQWLHFFDVADVAGASAVVRAQGGLVLAPVRAENGELFAAADDPQGAAFGLRQRG